MYSLDILPWFGKNGRNKKGWKMKEFLICGWKHFSFHSVLSAAAKMEFIRMQHREARREIKPSFSLVEQKNCQFRNKRGTAAHTLVSLSKMVYAEDRKWEELKRPVCVMSKDLCNLQVCGFPWPSFWKIRTGDSHQKYTIIVLFLHHFGCPDFGQQQQASFCTLSMELDGGSGILFKVMRIWRKVCYFWQQQQQPLGFLAGGACTV